MKSILKTKYARLRHFGREKNTFNTLKFLFPIAPKVQICQFINDANSNTIHMLQTL